MIVTIIYEARASRARQSKYEKGSYVSMIVYICLIYLVLALLRQLTEEYGEKDKLLNSTKELVKDPLVIEGADHNPFTSQPASTLNLLRKILEKK